MGKKSAPATPKGHPALSAHVAARKPSAILAKKASPPIQPGTGAKNLQGTTDKARY